MKIILPVILFTFASMCRAQVITRITLEDISKVNQIYGIDSAISIFYPVTDISFLDTAFAIRLAKQCDPVNPDYLQKEYFSQIGQKLRDTSISTKTFTILRIFNDRIKENPGSQEFNYIPDDLFRIVIFQEDSSGVSVLKQEFSRWEKTADSLRKHFPSALKRFFQKFSYRQPLVVENYRASKKNSYLFACTLNYFKSPSFSDAFLTELNKGLIGMDRQVLVKQVVRTPKYDTIQLSGRYRSLGEVDFQTELSLAKYRSYGDKKYCWQKIFTHGDRSLYEFGCSLGKENGRGEVIMAKLISPDKMVVCLIGGWIS